jgi:formate/nitrite transporter
MTGKTLMLAAVAVAATGQGAMAFAPPQRASIGARPIATTTSLFDSSKSGDWAKAEDDGRRSERASLDISKTIYTSSMKAPKDAYIAFAEKGAANAKMSKHKIFHQSVLGGAYVGFGGLLALTISGNIGGIAAGNPGIPKMVFAALFPVNLLLVVCTGGQLFTGNTATVTAARYEDLVTWREVTKSLIMSLAGNIVGCFAFAWAANYVGLMAGGTGDYCVATAMGKAAPPFGPKVVKAILCNWMVTLAVFLSGAANDLAGKLVGCWFPISTFVGIGLEHSVANLFIFPSAIMYGASLSWSSVILRNLFPVVLGNLIAGAILVAGSYSYQFGNLGKARREKFRARQARFEVRMALQRKAKAEERQAREEANGGVNGSGSGPIRKLVSFIF